jgi:hypothetical protein
MVTIRELLHLFRVALRAVFWGNDNRNALPFVHEGIFVARICLVTFKATDVGAEVLRRPIARTPLGSLWVTIDARFTLFRKLRR